MAEVIQAYEKTVLSCNRKLESELQKLKTIVRSCLSDTKVLTNFLVEVVSSKFL